MMRTVNALLRMLIGPFLCFLAGFIALTWPLLRGFSSTYWCGPGDGLQMVWNIWWVDHAIRELHQLPWYTTFLHYPEGTSLLMHTLHPLKGFMGMLLLPFLSLNETYNALAMYSFAMSGVTAFWLAYSISRAYWPSMLGGFVFTFSNYHFGHLQGAMQAISLEWMPVFVMLWYWLLFKPGLWTAVGAAVALWLVLLCEHYYFIYCVFLAALMTIWFAWHERRPWFWLSRSHRGPLLAFLAVAMVTSGILVVAMLLYLRAEPQSRIFEAWEFSMDALALWIPGAHWRFSELTRPYWSRIPGKIHGNSVYLGSAVLSMVLFAACRRRQLGRDAHAGFWLALGTLFAVLALGPRVHIAGWQVPYLGDWDVPLLRTPYAIVAKCIPALRIGARPVRMAIVPILCASVLVPLVVRYLWASGRRAQLIVCALLAILLFEFLPYPVTQTRPELPARVGFLASRHDGGAVYDSVTREPLAMFHQTIHEHPISFGYISRVPDSLMGRKAEQEAIAADSRFDTLRDRFGFRYLVVRRGPDVQAQCDRAQLVFEDVEVSVYDLGIAEAAIRPTRGEPDAVPNPLPDGAGEIQE